MNSEIIWQAFVDTGDPAFYLLYKTASGKEKADREREEKKKKDGSAGRSPSASD